MSGDENSRAVLVRIADNPILFARKKMSFFETFSASDKQILAEICPRLNSKFIQPAQLGGDGKSILVAHLPVTLDAYFSSQVPNRESIETIFRVGVEALACFEDQMSLFNEISLSNFRVVESEGGPNGLVMVSPLGEESLLKAIFEDDLRLKAAFPEIYPEPFLRESIGRRRFLKTAEMSHRPILSSLDSSIQALAKKSLLKFCLLCLGLGNQIKETQLPSVSDPDFKTRIQEMVIAVRPSWGETALFFQRVLLNTDFTDLPSPAELRHNPKDFLPSNFFFDKSNILNEKTSFKPQNQKDDSSPYKANTLDVNKVTPSQNTTNYVSSDYYKTSNTAETNNTTTTHNLTNYTSSDYYRTLKTNNSNNTTNNVTSTYVYRPSIPAEINEHSPPQEITTEVKTTVFRSHSVPIQRPSNPFLTTMNVADKQTNVVASEYEKVPPPLNYSIDPAFISESMKAMQNELTVSNPVTFSANQSGKPSIIPKSAEIIETKANLLEQHLEYLTKLANEIRQEVHRNQVIGTNETQNLNSTTTYNQTSTAFQSFPTTSLALDPSYIQVRNVTNRNLNSMGTAEAEYGLSQNPTDAASALRGRVIKSSLSNTYQGQTQSQYNTQPFIQTQINTQNEGQSINSNQGTGTNQSQGQNQYQTHFQSYLQPHVQSQVRSQSAAPLMRNYSAPQGPQTVAFESIKVFNNIGAQNTSTLPAIFTDRSSDMANNQQTAEQNLTIGSNISFSEQAPLAQGSKWHKSEMLLSAAKNNSGSNFYGNHTSLDKTGLHNLSSLFQSYRVQRDSNYIGNFLQKIL